MIDNGTPTAVPRRGRFCPTCLAVPDGWGWCKPHLRWECAKHVEYRNHADGFAVVTTYKAGKWFTEEIKGVRETAQA